MADEGAPQDVQPPGHDLRLPGPEDSRPALDLPRGDGKGAADVRLPGPARWNAGEVLLAVLSHFFWPALVSTLLLAAGFYTRVYGPDVVALAQGTAPEDAAARRLAQTRLGLWAVCLAFPLQLATVLLLFTRLADARLADLGVTGRRLGRNLLLGVLGALALTPVCYGVLQLAVWAYHWWGAGGVHEHPYTVLAQQPLWPGEWALLL